MAYNKLQNIYERIVNSNSYHDCELYFQSLSNTMITKEEFIKLQQKYSDLISQEICYKNAYNIIYNTHIPSLCRKYNINVVTQSTQTIYEYQKPKRTAPTLGDGWILYIVIMLLGSLFFDRIYIWFVASILFYLWRRAEIDRYN